MYNNNESIGEKIRSIRMAKGITINHISKKTGLTASFISQFERGKTKGSIASIKKITEVLGIKIASLFNDKFEMDSQNQQSTTIIRKENRRKLFYPDQTVDYLLTGTDSKLQVIYTIVDPGKGSGELYSHDSDEECIIVLKGKMEITVGKEKYILNNGDTISFSSRIPHGWKNAGYEQLEVLWVITPPSY